MKKPKTLPFLKMSPVMWPELESNQRHKDFQSCGGASFSCLGFPQITQDGAILWESLIVLQQILAIKVIRFQGQEIGYYGYITAFFIGENLHLFYPATRRRLPPILIRFTIVD